ncbi:hypothetical protein D3C80_287600 [compost metagenome]
MNQMAAQTVASLWPHMQGVGPLGTPARNSPFEVGEVTADRVVVRTGKSAKTKVVLPRMAFEAALGYLLTHGHHAGNPCEIAAADAPEKAGPLCLASRLLPSGKYGVRNITYVLPILQQLGVVEINADKPSRVWLVNQTAVPVAGPGLEEAVKVDAGASLLTPIQHAFADHLAVLWAGGVDSFVHRYAITDHRAWNTWKKRGHRGEWWCNSLPQAAAHYSWYEKPAPDDFASIAARLRVALAANDCRAAQQACEALFAWGNVALGKDGGARDWINAQVASATLCESILLAVELLQPGCSKSLEAFDDERLLMNSTMTKVYAAADPLNIIIYDGRVGAALGLLARRWLLAEGKQSVPDDLAFCWGGKRDDPADTRNPSLGRLRFSKLGYTPKQVLEWANLVRISNRILRQVASTLRAQGQSVRLLDLERALFMVGYNVVGGDTL